MDANESDQEQNEAALKGEDPARFQALESLLAVFDFEACRAHMIAKGWTWGGTGKKAYVPDAEQMKQTVRDLARSILADGGARSHEKGRFIVSSDAQRRWSIRFPKRT